MNKDELIERLAKKQLERASHGTVCWGEASHIVRSAYLKTSTDTVTDCFEFVTEWLSLIDLCNINSDMIVDRWVQEMG